MCFVFIDGPNNGCCISLLGNNKLMIPIREMPIDGNTSIFRLGGRYAIAQAHWMDLKFGDAIVGYNVIDFTKLCWWSQLLLREPIYNVINFLFRILIKL